ncbi:MAG: TIGR00282 family metallophosphoesterase [Candidatus Omnitrophota bacterium]
MVKILFIGDIVGEPGREAVRKIIPRLKEREQIDFVIANGENAAGGSGITPKIFHELISYDVDVVSSGDHIFKKKEVLDIIGQEERLLRPANYTASVPGRGYTIISCKEKKDVKIGVINLAGRVFMEPLECPFRTGMNIVEKIKKETKIAVVDIHAEATSEKIALGWYLNGKASAVVGTHTHVQTADERILPPHNYTAYITDIGMTGPVDSVIGRDIQQILVRFLNHTPTRFNVATENVQLQGVIVEIDEETGRALALSRIKECLNAA